MITVKWGPRGKKTWIELNIVTCEWSGTENQAARQLQFTLPWNPYDKGFNNKKVTLGDRVKLYDEKKLLFSGIVTSREKTATIGTASFSAYDYMHYLLRSKVSRVFHNTTPRAVTVNLCNQVKVKTGKLQDPKINIPRVIYKEQSIYDIIVAVYRKAYLSSTGKAKIKYMPMMSGDKLSVVKKGVSCGVTLKQDADILSATYHDTTDNMVNHVTIYNESNYKVSVQQDKKLINKYGYYMEAYTKEKGATASQKAKNLIVGVTKEASVEAIGNVKCVAGKSLKIYDKATGITGKFYITSDSHSFRDGVHTMKLELSQSNNMEIGATEEKEDD